MNETMSTERINRRERRGGRAKVALVAAVALAIAVQLIYGLAIHCSLDTWSDRGTFGDMFGAMGTLYSGLALAGIIYTIVQQREDLRASENAQEESIRIMDKQSMALREVGRLNALRVLLEIYEQQYLDATPEQRTNIAVHKNRILTELENYLANTRELPRLESPLVS